MKPGLCVCVVLASALAAFGCNGEEGDGFESFEPTHTPAADAAVIELIFEAPDAAVAAVAQSDAGAALQPADASLPPADLAAALSDAAAPPVPADPLAPPCFVTLHRDADGDGYGVPAETMLDCAANHAGYVSDDTDCFDGNHAAHPHIQGDIFFDKDRGDGSFDYNCDGRDEQQNTQITSCPVFTEADSHCPPGKVPYVPGDLDQRCYETQIRGKVDPILGGWSGAVPACGEKGALNFVITWSRETSYQCSPPPAKSADQIQHCR
jgi:hypothetical protein